MKYFLIIVLFISQFVFSQNVNENYPLHKIKIDNFITENKDTIKNCVITYRIFGKSNEDSSNIIFFPTWLAGNSENIGTLLSKYSFIDTNKFCIISIDALSNGYSSSPSNHINFPDISFDDLTRAYYLTLTQYLNISSLYAIVGGSMGGMIAFHFAVKYPNYSKKIVSYVSSPKLSTYDLLWINLQKNLVEYLVSINATKKNIKAFSDMITALVARTPNYLNRTVAVSDFNSYFQKFYKEPDSIYTLENYLTQLKAILTYDITKDFAYQLEQAAREIKSEMLIIVSDSDVMVNPQSAKTFTELKKAELVVLMNDCGHLAVNCEMEKVREIINNFLSSNILETNRE